MGKQIVKRHFQTGENDGAPHEEVVLRVITNRMKRRANGASSVKNIHRLESQRRNCQKRGTFVCQI